MTTLEQGDSEHHISSEMDIDIIEYIPCGDCICYAICRSSLIEGIDELNRYEEYGNNMFILQLVSSVLSHRCNLADRYVTKVESIIMDTGGNFSSCYESVSIDLNKCVTLLNCILKDTGIRFQLEG